MNAFRKTLEYLTFTLTWLTPLLSADSFGHFGVIDSDEE